MKISIITASLNSEGHIQRAIESVLEQQYDDIEHIVVDGGSTDGTVDILKKYPHIRWVSEADHGQSDAMNKGFHMSTGEIVVYLNSDDYFLADAFEKVIPLLEDGHKFVVGNVILRLVDGREFVLKPNVEYKKMLKHWEYAAFPNNPVQYFYYREVQERFPFNVKNRKTMDLEFLFDAASTYKFKKIDETLGVYPLLEGAVSVEAQKDPLYWSFDTFDFIDRHIKQLDKDEILQFKKEQQKAYLERTLQAMNEGKEHGEYNELMASIRKLASINVRKAPLKKYRYYKDVLKLFYRLGG